MSTPRHGHAPIPMRRLADADCDALQVAGDFAWDVRPNGQRFICLAIPVSKDDPKRYAFSRIPVKEGKNETGQWWGWDGNEDKPTLTPSLHCIGIWHGFITNGTIVEA